MTAVAESKSASVSLAKAAQPIGFALGVAVLVVIGCQCATVWAQDELFVANTANNSITVYKRTASGDAPPLRTLAGPLTGLGQPLGMFVDLVNDELVVANGGKDSITVYRRTASGDAPPLRTLAGLLTGLGGPRSIAVDLANNELFVANVKMRGTSITVYRRTDSGNVPPLRTLTGLRIVFGLSVDSMHNELIAANVLYPSSVMFFTRTASGDVLPFHTLSGPLTRLVPLALAVDPDNNELVVATARDSITVYSRTASGDAPPLRTLAGPLTGLDSPSAIAVDKVNKELLVANRKKDSITVYSRTASGDAPPLRTLAGPLTGLDDPQGIAVTAGAATPTHVSRWAVLVLLGIVTVLMVMALRLRRRV